jgi:hypothetical protein
MLGGQRRIEKHALSFADGAADSGVTQFRIGAQALGEGFQESAGRSG